LKGIARLIIWLSGPTGAGKSSFARLLEDRGWGVVRETIDPQIFGQFVTDPRKHCASFQASIMSSRVSQWENMTDKPHIVFDRSLEEDFHVFCRMHAEVGLLNSESLSNLSDIKSALAARVPRPDLIVYLNPGHDTLAKRVAVAHPPAIKDHLALQLSLYEEWIDGRSEDVLNIDNSSCRPDTLGTFLDSWYLCSLR
jgi:deoxyadenosine/deoxycytidine kinase